MEKKILIAIDHSPQSMAAIRYAAHMAAVIGPVRFVLLNIQPALSQYLTDEAHRDQSARQALEKVMAKNDAQARDVLNVAFKQMIRNGVDEACLEQVTMPVSTGVADDILTLGTTKKYDAILVARRGASYLQKWFMGSVTANLIEHSALIPIWVVDGAVPSDKILLAADGSQSALRALDHLAFMLSSHPTQIIQCLHVQPRLQDYCEIDLENKATHDAETVLLDDDQHCMENFHQQALAVLAKNGLDKNGLQLTSLDGKLSVARSILRFALDHEYGTVVMGRRGRSKSMFTGSVSRSLLQKAEGMALWMVP
ncbi:MAG: universal stress protein [Desulfobacterales bacterium]|jgi:nucleotide-binding universal stress UspA family protein